MQALSALTPGIQLHNAAGGNPDVGGSQQMEQTYIVGHGSSANQTTVLLDGMNINSNYLEGTIQNYVDNGIIQQATYQTSGVTADVSAGGALVNQIPKDGSHTFHTDVFLSGTGPDGLVVDQETHLCVIAKRVKKSIPVGGNSTGAINDRVTQARSRIEGWNLQHLASINVDVEPRDRSPQSQSRPLLLSRSSSVRQLREWV
jgi:hypothetical protein